MNLLSHSQGIKHSQISTYSRFHQSTISLAEALKRRLLSPVSYISGLSARRTAFYYRQRYQNKHSRFTTLNDISVHYRVEGPEQGDPILLIHGLSASLHAWDDWTHELSKTHRVIRFDLPGFGFTDVPGDQNVYKLENEFLVTLIDQLLNHLDVKTVHIAGNSLGGLTALRYSLRRPDRVSTLNLISPVAYAQQLPFMLRLGTAPFVNKVLLHLMPATLFMKSRLESIYGDPSRLTAEHLQRSIDLAMLKINRKSMFDAAIQLRRESKNDSFSDNLRSIKQPTLIMWGSKDSQIPVSYSGRLHADIPNSQLSVYPSAGHIPMMELPEVTASDYKQFLQQYDLCSGVSSKVT